jgi:hypothetical protein
MEKKKFIHEFDDCSQDGSLSFDTDAPPGAEIKMEIDEEGGFWLQANAQGWLHLAKVCAELGAGNYEDGYHLHKDTDFQWSTGAPEFTFVVKRTP